LPYDSVYPQFFPEARIAPSAILVGNVILANHTGVQEGCVLRADKNYIFLGAQTQILEGVIITTAPSVEEHTPGLGSVTIDTLTVIGPNCRLHACEIGERCSVGSNCVIRYGARLGDHSVLAAGSVVEEDQYIPSSEVWGGTPARFIRATGDSDVYQCMAEAEETVEMHVDYVRDETTYGTVWHEYDTVCRKIEDVLRNEIKGKLQVDLPPSLKMLLLRALPADQHPNPAPTVAQRLRAMFENDFQHNRFSEQRPVWAGNYNRPAMPEAMY
jgi:carbonic anhydrase/acetyltransferase-like protein (isoleucine patch superfamily)